MATLAIDNNNDGENEELLKKANEFKTAGNESFKLNNWCRHV